MQADVVVEELALDDDGALDEMLAFAAQHGTPRSTSAVAYRDLMRENDAWGCFVARVAGDIRAVAQSSINPAIGLDQAQLNAFLTPGSQDAFDAVLDAVDAWTRDRGGVAMTAHVSGPSDDDLDAWIRSGFEQVGERARVILDVSADDVARSGLPIDGLVISSLAERPDLGDAADELWRVGLDDVPSALRFSSDAVPSLTDEMYAGGDRTHAILALDPGDRVVGLAMLVRTVDPAVAGHRMTATARDWRGRGVAHALKVESIRWAAANGVTRLQASNDSENAPMKAINDRLGYRLEYRLVLMRRQVRRSRPSGRDACFLEHAGNFRA